MHSKHTAEQCWPFLLFLGIQMPDSGSVPSFPSALNPSCSCVIVSSQVLKAELKEMQRSVPPDALGWMALLLIPSLPYMPPRSSLCFTCYITLQISFLCAVKGKCRNHHLRCRGVLSSRKCAWHCVSCLTQCLLYIWPACQGRDVIKGTVPLRTFFFERLRHIFPWIPLHGK